MSLPAVLTVGSGRPQGRVEPAHALHRGWIRAGAQKLHRLSATQGQAGRDLLPGDPGDLGVSITGTTFQLQESICVHGAEGHRQEPRAQGRKRRDPGKCPRQKGLKARAGGRRRRHPGYPPHPAPLTSTRPCLSLHVSTAHGAQGLRAPRRQEQSSRVAREQAGQTASARQHRGPAQPGEPVHSHRGRRGLSFSPQSAPEKSCLEQKPPPPRRGCCRAGACWPSRQSTEAE